MAWTAPMTFVANSTLTAAQLNTHLRDNLMETAPSKATTAGSYFVGTGVNQITERIWQSNTILTSESTTSTSFADLTTVGPAITTTTSNRAILMLCCNLQNNTVASSLCMMGVDITGASTVSAADADSLIYETSATTTELQMAYVNVYNGLTPGVNTFTAKYRVSAGTGVFGRRRIVVLPF